MNNKKIRLVLLTLTMGLLTGCFGRVTIVVTATPSLAPSPSPIPTEVPLSTTPTPPLAEPTNATEALAATLSSTASANTIKLWLSPDVPPEYQEALDPLVASGRYAWSSASAAQVKLVSAPPSGGLVTQRIYAPVVPFPTATDDVKWADIQRYWQGEIGALSSLSESGQPPEFVTTSAIQAWLVQQFGPPSPLVRIDVVPPDAIVTTLWLHRAAAWALAPFDKLDPAMKVLTLDGASVFDRQLDLNKYPLIQTFAFSGDPQLVVAVENEVKQNGKWITTNRDLSRMTIFVMTGVTALGRATAYQMELKGITLPARDILPFMQDADLVHTSNEVAFAKDCPYPDPSYTNTTQIRFCSKESYFDLLKTIHLSIVELTGNHVNDWGTPAFSNSLDLYDANKVGYFGGGRNEEDARKALIVTNNGNTIALIGCNPVGPAPAWAKTDRPGAARCNDDFLAQEIPRLKTVANVVIMTIQYQEFYQYNPTLDQVAYFQKFATLGADLVMGSQAHVPQGFNFTGNAFIHYGIGNLFFDQMDSLQTRQMFADKLIIYKGKHISTVLFTGLLEDYSRPRRMTADERKAFLKDIFKASGW
ncbi:MAG: CapA family protein [Chloroflexota bacterium]